MNVHAGIDHAVGLATRAVQRRLPPARHSAALLDALRDRPVDELFPAPAPDPRGAVGVFRGMGGFRSRILRFESEHLPLVPELRDRYREESALHVFRARELRVGRAPRKRAIVYVHGWMEANEELSDLLLAPLLARALAADVVSLKLPHHWSRQLPDSTANGILYCTADLARTAEAFRQSVMDARTLVEHLVGRGVYEEVGVLGISLGGVISSLMACVEPRLAFAVPFLAHLDLADLVRHAEILVEVRLELQRSGVGDAQIEGWLAGIGFQRLTPVLEGRRVMPVAARDDAFMRPETVRRQFERWPGVEVTWIPGGHITSLLALPKILPKLRQRLDAL